MTLKITEAHFLVSVHAVPLKPRAQVRSLLVYSLRDDAEITFPQVQGNRGVVWWAGIINRLKTELGVLVVSLTQFFWYFQENKGRGREGSCAAWKADFILKSDLWNIHHKIEKYSGIREGQTGVAQCRKSMPTTANSWKNPYLSVNTACGELSDSLKQRNRKWCIINGRVPNPEMTSRRS